MPGAHQVSGLQSISGVLRFILQRAVEAQRGDRLLLPLEDPNGAALDWARLPRAVVDPLSPSLS